MTGLPIAGVGPENFLRLRDRRRPSRQHRRPASSLAENSSSIWSSFSCRSAKFAAALSRFEFHTASAASRLFCFEHEGLRPGPFAARDLGHRAARRYRSIVGQKASSSLSRANSSRCLISSQLVRLPPLRSRFIRTSTQLPCSRSPSSLNFRFPDLSAASGDLFVPSGVQ